MRRINMKARPEIIQLMSIHIFPVGGWLINMVVAANQNETRCQWAGSVWPTHTTAWHLMLPCQENRWFGVGSEVWWGIKFPGTHFSCWDTVGKRHWHVGKIQICSPRLLHCSFDITFIRAESSFKMVLGQWDSFIPHNLKREKFIDICEFIVRR